MEHIASCNECGWNEAWTTREAAEAAAVVHVRDRHPEIWQERMGDAELPENTTGRVRPALRRLGAPERVSEGRLARLRWVCPSRTPAPATATVEVISVL